MGVPRVTRHIPYRLAFAGGFLLEMRDRLLARIQPPRVTRYGAWLLGRYLEYSTEKARTRLDWETGPRLSREHREHHPLVPGPGSRSSRLSLVCGPSLRPEGGHPFHVVGGLERRDTGIDVTGGLCVNDGRSVTTRDNTRRNP
jgi:hypothetical protein